MPQKWPEQLRARQVLEYLERYAAEYGVADAVQTSTKVTAVEPSGDQWSTLPTGTAHWCTTR